MLTNIPEVKLGIIAVSRDCFIISLSEVFGRGARVIVRRWKHFRISFLK